MMNNIAQRGPEIAMGAGEGLHTSGHAYQDELDEVATADIHWLVPKFEYHAHFVFCAQR